MNNEVTSERVAVLAAQVLSVDEQYINEWDFEEILAFVKIAKSLAGSALTQRPNID